MDSMKFKINHNKKNNQLFIALSRKKLQILKKKVPRFLEAESVKVEY